MLQCCAVKMPYLSNEESGGTVRSSSCGHHPVPRQRQKVGVQRACLPRRKSEARRRQATLAGEPHDPAHPVLVLLAQIAKGPDTARLQTDQGAT